MIQNIQLNKKYYVRTRVAVFEYKLIVVEPMIFESRAKDYIIAYSMDTGTKIRLRAADLLPYGELTETLYG